MHDGSLATLADVVGFFDTQLWGCDLVRRGEKPISPPISKPSARGEEPFASDDAATHACARTRLRLDARDADRAPGPVPLHAADPQPRARAATKSASRSWPTTGSRRRDLGRIETTATGDTTMTATLFDPWDDFRRQRRGGISGRGAGRRQPHHQGGARHRTADRTARRGGDRRSGRHSDAGADRAACPPHLPFGGRPHRADRMMRGPGRMPTPISPRTTRKTPARSMRLHRRVLRRGDARRASRSSCATRSRADFCPGRGSKRRHSSAT